MKGYSADELRAVLREVGVVRGDVLCVHSSLLTLGPLENVALREMPAAIAHLLLDSLGPEGTLVVPTFNFDFAKGKSYDRQRTPSRGMGTLSEYVRMMPGSMRSPHPLQSVAAVGRRATEICERDTPSPFEPGSAWATLVDLNARVLLLGTVMQYATVFHVPEQAVGVPYRYWKDFTAPYVDQGVTQERTYRLYVRDLDLDPYLELARLEKALRARGVLKEAPLGSGMVQAVLSRDMADETRRLLAQDPNYFVAGTHSDVLGHHSVR